MDRFLDQLARFLDDFLRWLVRKVLVLSNQFLVWITGKTQALLALTATLVNIIRSLIAQHWHYLRWPLSVLAVAHLVLVFLFPGGANRLFGVAQIPFSPQLTWFAVHDSLGLDPLLKGERFYAYKIFTQDDEVVTGSIPNATVRPKLRHDRWFHAGHLIAGTTATQHEQVLAYVVERLPVLPLRLELYKVRWSWDRNSLSAPWNGEWPVTSQDAVLLGTYNGITQVWTPALTAEEAAPAKSVKKKGVK